MDKKGRKVSFSPVKCQYAIGGECQLYIGFDGRPLSCNGIRPACAVGKCLGPKITNGPRQLKLPWKEV